MYISYRHASYPRGTRVSRRRRAPAPRPPRGPYNKGRCRSGRAARWDGASTEQHTGGRRSAGHAPVRPDGHATTRTRHRTSSVCRASTVRTVPHIRAQRQQTRAGAESVHSRLTSERAGDAHSSDQGRLHPMTRTTVAGATVPSYASSVRPRHQPRHQSPRAAARPLRTQRSRRSSSERRSRSLSAHRLRHRLDITVELDTVNSDHACINIRGAQSRMDGQDGHLHLDRCGRREQYCVEELGGRVNQIVVRISGVLNADDGREICPSKKRCNHALEGMGSAETMRVLDAMDRLDQRARDSVQVSQGHRRGEDGPDASAVGQRWVQCLEDASQQAIVALVAPGHVR